MVLYAVLLGAALLLVSLFVHSAVVGNAERLVRQELEASATVFDRIWDLRSRQLHDTASVLSRDFGFREAVATGDEGTVQSALANLSGRLGLDLALIVGLDGVITSVDGRDLGEASKDLLSAMDSDDGPSGVLLVGDTPYQAVSAPMLAPVLTGWVVFGAKLDAAEMTSLEKLSAIPLDAMVLNRRTGAGWRSVTSQLDEREGEAIQSFLERAFAGGEPPSEIETAEGASIAVAKPLKAVSADAPFVLMLRYPLARALAPYRPLINAMLATGLLGAVVLLGGSWVLARSVTEPISALDEAARRLARGEDASVQVKSQDEIGRLAESFNTMAAEIRERERGLAAALERAESANRLTGEFLANMSHEIRTPLNGVLGLSQVLARTSRDPAQREMTTAIIESAGALERLLCDILEAAQLHSGAAELRVEPFDLGLTVEAVIAPWRIAAQDKGLSFSVAIDPVIETTVVGDADRLQQILNALLSNAVKFTARGEVRLRACAGEQGFRFEVLDTGIGIDPTQKEAIFAPFRQADGSSTRKQGGAGLGLSVAVGFAKLMGGALDCARREGGGSVFWVDLPFGLAASPSRAVA